MRIGRFLLTAVITASAFTAMAIERSVFIAVSESSLNSAVL